MCKHKYKPGDIVRVRHDLEADKEYNGIMFISDMEKYMGNEYMIEYVYPDCYTLKEICYFWTDDMFELFEFNMPDKDNLIDFLSVWGELNVRRENYIW